MKTLKDRQIVSDKWTNDDDLGDGTKYFLLEDVENSLENFYKDYWKNSYLGDKNKSHITCDDIDYLLDKHFGSLVKIKTMQYLKNQ